jgi:type I restriction enzyme R subunit
MTTSQKFTEAKLERAIIELLERQDYPYTRGTDLERWPSDVLIRSDLREFLASRYAADQVLESEIDSIIRQLDALISTEALS